MKAKRITYWIATTFLACDMALAGVLYLTHAPFLMRLFAHLGYPPYFPDILGVAKILGACVLLVPGCVAFKEWAYAGFGITFVSGFVSHLIVGGDVPLALASLIALAVLSASYLTRPAGRRWFPQP